MQNKHKMWILLGVVIIALVGVVGLNNQTPFVKITDPNSTDSGTDPITYTVNTIMGKNNGTQSSPNPQQTTPQPQKKDCPTCKATGEITCPKCNGAVTCWKCLTCQSLYPRKWSGNGWYTTACKNCENKGISYAMDFYDCSCGNGKVTCPDCKGTKKVPA